MSNKLQFILHDLVRRAGTHIGAATPVATLQKGLNLSMKATGEALTLCLFRDAVTPPSREEALICAHALHWPGPVITEGRTTKGYPALFMSPAMAPQGLPFTPGTPCSFLPDLKHMPERELLGLLAGQEWVTFIREGDRLMWRSMTGPGVGSGTRGELEAFLKQLSQVAA